MGGIVFSNDDDLLQLDSSATAQALASSSLFSGQKVYIRDLGMYYFSPAVLPILDGELVLDDRGGKFIKYTNPFIYLDDDNQISHLNIGEVSKEYDAHYRYDGDTSGSDQLNDVVIGRIPDTASTMSFSGTGLGMKVLLEENFAANASLYTNIFLYKRSSDGSGKTLIAAISNNVNSFTAFSALDMNVSVATLNAGDVITVTTSKVGGSQFLPPMSIFLNGVPTS